MDSITLENFRCFYEKQTVPLAPLTLLVGENSTGKTSFMAMVRILWDVIYNREGSNFNEEPFELGTFNDIAHHRGAKGGQAKYFYAGFENNKSKFGVKFEKKGTTPLLIKKEVSQGYNSIIQEIGSQNYVAIFSTSNGSWKVQRPAKDYDTLEELPGSTFLYFISNKENLEEIFKPVGDSPTISLKDWEQIRVFDRNTPPRFLTKRALLKRPYASAPVRSRPRRTYDPHRLNYDPEGDNIPNYLASISIGNGEHWQKIKTAIEKFGRQSGILDELKIRHLGDDSEPFKIMVKKGEEDKIGPWRNLADVGYGVSQILPILTQIFDGNNPDIFLLQQPEVHLHPMAQAALATLFCRYAKRNRQFIIETHSDNIIDRVRMEVRDGLIKPNDVTLLFFERQGLNVKIHPIKFDEEGNVIGAPLGYRKFFLEEVDRSIGL